MLKPFYDVIGDNENAFLGHRFPEKDEVDAEINSSDDDDDNDEDNKRDDGDETEEEECEIEDNSNYNNDVIPEEVSTSNEGEKKTMRDKITRMMKLTMYKKNQQENKNLRILINL